MTARKTYRPTPHTPYEYVIAGPLGGQYYKIQHYALIGHDATQETNITAAWGDGLELYTHRTRNDTPTTWRNHG